MYGTNETSWCPHCHEPEWVFEKVGELPDPQLYGCWLLEEEEAKRQPPATWKGSDMKTRKLHTGTYSCPRCCFEFDIVAEDSLKCDECGGPLVSGSLEDLWEDEGELSD